MTFPRLPALSGILSVVLLLAGCAKPDLNEPPVDLGPFQLGLNIVVADNMKKVPISRDATEEEWETGLKKAVQDRFGRYGGDRLYNIGINIDGYALAPPGIPVLAAPQSVVVVSANIWDDANQAQLNTEAKQFTVFENLSGESVIGTGLTSTKNEQIDALSYNVAKAVEGWFLENPQWFDAAGAIPDPPAEGSSPTPAAQVVPPAPSPAKTAAPVTVPVPTEPSAATPVRSVARNRSARSVNRAQPLDFRRSNGSVPPCLGVVRACTHRHPIPRRP